MDLRITPESMSARILAQTQQQTARLAKLQEQASTGKKVLLPSDDPVRLGSLLAGKAQAQGLALGFVCGFVLGDLGAKVWHFVLSARFDWRREELSRT